MLNTSPLMLSSFGFNVVVGIGGTAPDIHVNIQQFYGKGRGNVATDVELCRPPYLNAHEPHYDQCELLFDGLWRVI